MRLVVFIEIVNNSINLMFFDIFIVLLVHADIFFRKVVINLYTDYEIAIFTCV